MGTFCLWLWVSEGARPPTPEVLTAAVHSTVTQPSRATRGPRASYLVYAFLGLGFRIFRDLCIERTGILVYLSMKIKDSRVFTIIRARDSNSTMVVSTVEAKSRKELQSIPPMVIPPGNPPMMQMVRSLRGGHLHIHGWTVLARFSLRS